MGHPHRAGLLHIFIQRQTALHEAVNVFVGRVVKNVLRRADLDQFAVLEDRDPVADANRLIEIVGDKHQRFEQLFCSASS